MAIAYPPNWSVEEDAGRVAFVHPSDLPGVQISTLGSEFRATTAEQLRDDYYADLTKGCRDVELQWIDSDTYGGVAFEDLAALCENASGEVRFLYVAVGIQGQTKWAILVVDTDDYADNIDTFFNPMLATLNFGTGQAAAQAAPTLTVTPAEVKSGGTVTFQGTGFEPGVGYGVLITDESGQRTGYLEVDADGDGAFAGTIQVSSPGVRLVKVLFGGGDIVATARFVVVP